VGGWSRRIFNPKDTQVVLPFAFIVFPNFNQLCWQKHKIIILHPSVKQRFFPGSLGLNELHLALPNKSRVILPSRAGFWFLGSHYGGSMLKRHFWDNAAQWHDPQFLVQYHEHGNMAHITYTSSCLGRTQQTIHYFQVGPVDPSQITQQKLRMGVGPEHAFIPNWAARCTVKFCDSKWWKVMENDTRRVCHAICTQFKIFSHVLCAVASSWSPPVLPGFHLWHPLFTTALRGSILPQGTLASDTARIFKTSAIRHQSSIRNQ